jgi:HSP20 family protein
MSLTKWSQPDFFPTIDLLWNDLLDNDSLLKGVKLGTSIPAVNVKETNKHFELESAVPGFKKNDFKIDINNGILTISSEKKEEKEEKDGNKMTRREFEYSSFCRSFALPENVDDTAISAEYKDGLLKVEIPKKENSKSDKRKTINIK